MWRRLRAAYNEGYADGIANRYVNGYAFNDTNGRAYDEGWQAAQEEAANPRSDSPKMP